MPRVPETQLGGVQSRPMQSPSAPMIPTTSRASAAEFGIPQLASLQSSVGAMAQIAIDEQDKANKIRTMEADRELSRIENELLYGDNGALTRKGRNAFGIPDQTLGELQSEYKRIHDSLANDAQRETFNRLWYQREPQIQRTLLRHERQQIDSYQDSEQDAYTAMAAETIALNYSNPERVAIEMQKIEDTRIMQGADDGLPPEAVDMQIRRDQSAAISGAVSRSLSNRDYSAARGLLDNYGDRMSPADYDRANATLRDASMRAAVREHTQRITSSGGDLISMIQQARQIGGEVGEKVRDGVVRFHREQEMLRNEQERINTEQAYQIIEASRGNTDAIPDELYAQLPSNVRASLDRAADEIAMRGEPVTSFEVVDELDHMAYNDPQGFSRMNLLAEYGDRLNRADRQKYLAMQESVRGGSDSPGGKSSFTQVEAPSTMVSTIMQENAGTNRKGEAPPLATDPTLKGLLIGQVQEFITTYESTNGHKPDPVTLRDFTQTAYDRALIEGIVRDSGVFRDDRVKLYEVDEEDRAAFYIKYEDIPRSERDKIKDTLERRGRPVTKEAVERMFAERLLN